MSRASVSPPSASDHERSGCPAHDRALSTGRDHGRLIRTLAGVTPRPVDQAPRARAAHAGAQSRNASPVRNRSRWRPRQTVTRPRPCTCQVPSRPTSRRVLVDPQDHDPPRRLERDRARRTARARRRSGAGRRPRRPARARPASGWGTAAGSAASARAGSPSCGPTSAIAPAEQPAMTAPRAFAIGERGTQGRAEEDACQVVRVAAGEVDEVGLADRLERGRVVAAGDGRARAPAPPRRRGPRSARRPSRPSREDVPRRRARRRSAGSRRAGAGGRSTASRPRSNSAMGARNSPAPTSATGPGIGRSLVQEPGTGRGGPMTRQPDQRVTRNGPP